MLTAEASASVDRQMQSSVVCPEYSVPSGLQAKEIITVCACSRAAAVRMDIASDGCSSVLAASRSAPISPVIGGHAGGLAGSGSVMQPLGVVRFPAIRQFVAAWRDNAISSRLIFFCWCCKTVRRQRHGQDAEGGGINDFAAGCCITVLKIYENVRMIEKPCFHAAVHGHSGRC